MKQRQIILLLIVVIPGLAAAVLSGFFLFPDWTALDASHRQYQELARSPSSTLRDLSIAQAGENRHRINCFAEGIGVLLGGVIAAIGIHGICTLYDKQS
ncbi:MAG TPA: hypothetical protein DEG17_20325 [Cyanobacteria bacterium UBA11149]|nr:hypothetical protein [Cyanobacteria bacterium UBA11367]HBE58873.1 hypothetical protein [Cyanobacteria bacterium UBA11366]HBK62522.1 hypothetical protein [Cyanobacteria bacterium UBA11166]HBR75828.1 hypothetical protein [Cyanobacteria bacterium UBA11159]HBS72309.1 hypothetical protein [Cyanobacteria bacterium UBA11153]HBW91143.1 hypothetical protein [Cyanobacteria bacterium UBA11149]HCA94967.1 hypothetical protein [Cyanobacteria bacterium UBA9226]